MKMIFRRYWALVPVLAVLLAAGCGKSDSKAPPPPPKVGVALPEQREVLEYEDLPGRVEAMEVVEVKARVTGYLNKVEFKEGAEVNQGDLLYTIDPREFQADADSAAAALQQAQAKLAQAQSDYERARQLSKQTAISQQELESRATAMREADAGVRLAQASLTRAKLNVEYSEIRAPIAGKIGSTNITAGNLVEDGDALTTIVSQSPVYIYCEVPERLLLRWDKAVHDAIKDGLTARARVTAGLMNEEGFPREGRVDFSDNEMNEGTGTLRMRAVFPNDDRRLRVGLYARVRVSTDRPQKALLVPDRAIGIDQGQRYLYVLGADNKVEYRRVGIGQVYDGMRAIREGLEPGERVVVEGTLALRPGIVVDPEEVAIGHAKSAGASARPEVASAP